MREAKVYLWNGFCVVHQMFDLEDITEWREKEPDIRIIVHPECPFDLIQAADALTGPRSGSCAPSPIPPPEASGPLGTEINLVCRLADRNLDKMVVSLSPHQAICANMYKTAAVRAACLGEPCPGPGGKPYTRRCIRHMTEARQALTRMLSLS